uniref:Putative secreted peptide n=1 Tax=Anopheles braziliensis TaxID=58242 RepID=A0A2M3ZR49_9DIPT
MLLLLLLLLLLAWRVTTVGGASSATATTSGLHRHSRTVQRGQEEVALRAVALQRGRRFAVPALGGLRFHVDIRALAARR